MGRVREESGMTLIVKTVTRITLGFILLYGVYVAINGHQAPGGGFVGGVIVALSFVHIMLAFGKKVALKRLHSNTLRIFIGVAALVFLFMVMVPWRENYSRLAMPLFELVAVGGGLFAIFIALVLLSKFDKDSE
ncbi:MAG: MnhB domain-containing protein [Candidatus Omnitrophota bacterium]|nr:MnhB domain-containing protein [Candidatus Omnitrophota bacterium]